jgi:sulfonate transport system ATP-binding protein
MIELAGVSKRFDGALLAVSDVDLTVGASEIVAVIGPSGCGKSTVLRLIAGLESPTSGLVRVAGEPIAGPSRSVGVVFQEPRLMPWLTVEQNVSFGLRGDDARDLASEALDHVGLGAFAGSLPKELSGGMAQRTAIARALVTKPPVLMLDEPFSALDAFTRIDLQDHLLEVWRWYRPTMFLVTHDIDEALVLADRVLVFSGRPGRIEAEIRVDLPRPRDRSESEFHSLQDRAMAALAGSSRDRGAGAQQP